MEVAISLSNISATALNILRTPELLYFPQAVKEHLVEIEYVPSRDKLVVEATVVGTCFVCSSLIAQNYYHVWDVTKSHHQQVSQLVVLSLSMSCMATDGRQVQP